MDRALSTADLLTDLVRLVGGPLLGIGADRIVMESSLFPGSVVKIARHRRGIESNQTEWHFWGIAGVEPELARWLAPCSEISPGGMVLIQKKTEPISLAVGVQLTVPTLFGDNKVDNWGLIDGQHVCHDYASIRSLPGTHLFDEHLHRQKCYLSACEPFPLANLPQETVLAKIEEDVPGGCAGLLARLRSPDYTLDDISSLFRILLEGGGVSNEEAVRIAGLIRGVRTKYDIVAEVLAAALMSPPNTA